MSFQLYHLRSIRENEQTLLTAIQRPTDEQRLASLDRLFANAGTYEVVGGEIRMKIIVSKSSRATAEQPENVATLELRDLDTLIITDRSGAVLTVDRLEESTGRPPGRGGVNS